MYGSEASLISCMCFAAFVLAVTGYDDDDSADVTMLRYVVVPCVSLVVVVILASVVACVCRHQRRRRHATDGGKYPRPAAAAEGGALCRNGHGLMPAAASEVAPPEYLVSSVQLVRDVCQDQRFAGSRVYVGLLAVGPQRQCQRSVVVWTLAVDANERTRAEFWRDVDALHALRHQHVCAVVGVTGRTVLGLPASVLLESGPDMLNLHQYVVYAGHDPTSLDHASRLRIAAQIAAGMNYLSSRCIVHGDLAARNVMMISTPGPAGLPPVVAKVSVGLSVGPALFPADYQKLLPDCAPVPVRWMCPEAIAAGGGSLTPPCDVWSYGITLWELYSAGCRPYEGFDDNELVELILTRQLLPCPPPPPQTGLETSRVYALMMDCWAVEPERRPTFADVLARLEQWQAADATGRCQDSSSRSNSTRSNPDTVPPPRRQSPFTATPATLVCRAANDSQASTVVVTQPLDAVFQLPVDCPVVRESSQSKLTAVGNLAPHGRRTSTSLDESRHDNKQQQLLQPTGDRVTLRTVDVL